MVVHETSGYFIKHLRSGIYLAASYAVQETLWLPRLMHDIHTDATTPHPQNALPPTPIYIDIQSAIAVAHNHRNTKRRKHIDVKYHPLTHHVASRHSDLQHIPGAENPADAFMKSLSPPLFTLHTAPHIKQQPQQQSSHAWGPRSVIIPQHHTKA